MNNDHTVTSMMKQTSHSACDLVWLKNALQVAIELEFSTIPPYLCALWSIKDDLHPVAKSIREVVQEEMLHMAMACNLLAAIGGSPSIRAAAPSYPCELPGEVQRKLKVMLSGLNKHALTVFLRIERPDNPMHIEGDDRPSKPEPDQYTIGEFYEAIYSTFKMLSPSLSPERQIPGPLWNIVQNPSDVAEAIRVITHQGEGSSDTPADTGTDDLAHYYRFLEIKKRRRIILDGKKWRFGNRYDLPEVWPMAAVPKNGYQKDQVGEDCWVLLEECDRLYSGMIYALDDAWADGGQARLMQAIEFMFRLAQPARTLMQIPIPGREKTYGPCFRLIPQQTQTGA